MTDEQIRAYLLHELSDEESERFEDELFAAGEWETDTQAVEDDLIEDYVRGELSPDQKRRFEENFLVTESRQERLRMAAAFIEHADKFTSAEQKEAEKAAETKASWWENFLAGWNAKPLALRFTAGFVVVVLLAGIVWYVGFRAQRQPILASLSLTSVSNERDVGNAPPPATTDLQGKDGLKLTLALPDRSSMTATYQAELVSSANKISLDSVTREGTNLVVTIPANQLPPGNYVVEVSFIESGGAPQRIGGVYKFAVK